jgi:hypothetical protein
MCTWVVWFGGRRQLRSLSGWYVIKALQMFLFLLHCIFQFAGVLIFYLPFFYFRSQVKCWTRLMKTTSQNSVWIAVLVNTKRTKVQRFAFLV